MEEFDEFYEKFQELYGHIETELKNNNQLSIDSMIINMSVNDILNFISNYAPFSFDMLKKNTKVRNIFIDYLYKKKFYYDSLSLSNDKLGLLLSKDNAGQKQHSKTESFYYNESDQEKYLDDILKRLIDCVNIYYDVYYNKPTNVLLGDGTKLSLQFLEENLLHILGITPSQVKGNPELKKVLNISDNKSLSSIEILERIIKDIQTNKDILCLQMKKNLEMVKDNGVKGKIVKTQLKDETESELLPYDKIDLKTRAFINSGPYQDASAISNINDGSYFILDDKGKDSSSKDIQQVRISKADFGTLEKGSVVNKNKINISNGDYVFNGYTKRDDNVRTIKSTQVGTSKIIIPTENGGRKNNIGKFRAMFSGQSPLPIIGVENPGGGADTMLYFTPEQQTQLFLSLYYDFGGQNGMNLNPYIEILKDFVTTFEHELESQAIAKTENGIIVPTSNSLRK